jgi:hypothetical protein
MILKIKKTGAFKDRKIDDLIEMFGKRRCESMLDLKRVWCEEEDLRRLESWPLSPHDSDCDSKEVCGIMELLAIGPYVPQPEKIIIKHDVYQ